MEKKAKVPKLRFPGFTDDWEQRKLGEVAKFSKGSGYCKDDLVDKGIPIILYGRLYTKYQTQIINVDTFVTEQSNSVYSTGKEVIVPASGETAEDISIASAVMKSGILLGGDLNIVYPYETLNSVFLAVQLSNGNAKKEMSKRAQGKSVVHLHNADLQEAEISIPQIAEQQQIGCFFEQFDNLITLHQRKLTHLQAKKKSLLQKMFPKRGECFPELRFPGFTDAWEQRKLGEITDSYSGGTPSVGVKEYYGGDIPFIRSAEINSNKTELSITPKGLKNSSARMAKIGDILYALYGATSGEVGLASLKGAVNQAVLVIQPHNEYCPEFLMQWLRKSKQNIIDTYLQGGQGNLSGTIVKSLVIDYPSQEEQKKIGAYFKSFDNLITLHQRKLAHLQRQKKALLQQMFV